MAHSPAVLSKADHLGFAASLLCAVHCALFPLALALLPSLGLQSIGWVDLDQAFVVFATGLGVATLTLGWRRHHAYRAWVVLLPGLLLVWLASFTGLHQHTFGHAVAMTVGGTLLAAGHWLNLRLTHAAELNRRSTR
jgi:hypothetical protein